MGITGSRKVRAGIVVAAPLALAAVRALGQAASSVSSASGSRRRAGQERRRCTGAASPRA